MRRVRPANDPYCPAVIDIARRAERAARLLERREASSCLDTSCMFTLLRH